MLKMKAARRALCVQTALSWTRKVSQHAECVATDDTLYQIEGHAKNVELGRAHRWKPQHPPVTA